MGFLSNWKTVVDKALFIFLLVLVSKFKVAMKFHGNNILLLINNILLQIIIIGSNVIIVVC